MKGKTLPGSIPKGQPPVSAAGSFPSESGRGAEELRVLDVPQPPLKGIVIARLPKDGPPDLAGVQAGDRVAEATFVSEPAAPDAGSTEASPKGSPLPTVNHVITVSSQESGTKPLTFTFVPSIGRLPTHFEVVDISKFLVTIPEEPKDLSNQKIVNKSEAVSDELVLKSGAKQDCVCTDSTRMAFQSLGCNSSKGEMQENDLFKAEFILITDSGDEDEVAAASNNAPQPSNGYSPISAQLLTTSHVSPGTRAGKPPGDGHLPGVALSHSTTDPQKHQALEEPSKPASVTEGTALDTHSEMCSPAQLRQQTEELCAVIDQVLQDPLTMRRCESSPSFLQMSTESDVGKMSTTLQRAAGRETRYANLYKSVPIVTESQLTKPGVIRPVLVKGKSAQQKEEPYQPNPFKKYLEEISDQNIEQHWRRWTKISVVQGVWVTGLANELCKVKIVSYALTDLFDEQLTRGVYTISREPPP
ncbi:PREDICTED: muscular LMNA-interacting protein [Sturnus vulgaris]|uniref:muscular LMNA-interacting protein n=1 Tax=Sturnus vulgaris TaxID=9172 RepID=UPI00071A8AB9|nr:PREDICTED: muscular LMNA-interacting protein [Sturnus vulgaris]